MKHVLIAITILFVFACKKDKDEKPKTDDVVYRVTCDSCEIWFANDTIEAKTIEHSWEYHMVKPQGDQAILLSVGAWEKTKYVTQAFSLQIYYSGELVQEYTDNDMSDTTHSPMSLYYTIPKK